MNIKEKLAVFSKLVWDRGLTESTGGNMSVRDGDAFHITPTFVIKHFLNADEMATVSLSGEHIAGAKKPSSEYRMHLAIYQKDPEVGAVFHAHPVHATAVAIRGLELPVNALPEMILLLAPVAYLPYRMPGTQEFADAFEQALERGCRVFFLRNHGVTVTGKTIEEAYSRLEMVEFLSRIAITGGVEPGQCDLSKDEIFRHLENQLGRRVDDYVPSIRFDKDDVGR